MVALVRVSVIQSAHASCPLGKPKATTCRQTAKREIFSGISPNSGFSVKSGFSVDRTLKANKKAVPRTMYRLFIPPTKAKRLNIVSSKRSSSTRLTSVQRALVYFVRTTLTAACPRLAHFPQHRLRGLPRSVGRERHARRVQGGLLAAFVPSREGKYSEKRREVRCKF